MNRAVSLLPAPVVRRRNKDRRVRRWTVACVVTAVLGATVASAVRTWSNDPNAVSSEDLRDAEEALTAFVRQRDALHAEALAAATTLRAVRAAADHPDWSILLAYLSDLCQDRITLLAFVLEPAADGNGFDISIDGAGRTQQDVAHFLLALEQSGVFTSTRLNNAGAASSAGVAFSATCLIRTGPPAEEPAEEAPKGSGTRGSDA